MERVDTTVVPADVAGAWLRRWDVQQERYIADREERFAVIVDVVEVALRGVDRPVIVDLGCGPGSLSARLRERLPQARIIGVDSDPLLLGLGRAHYGDAIEWVDDDLIGASWLTKVPETIHAAVSTTALHWLPADGLADVYRDLAARTAPGGVCVNGDHLGVPDERLQSLAEAVRDRRAERAGVLGNEDWRTWWDAIADVPELAGLARERAERPARHDGNGLTVADHIRLLTAAGYASVAPLWQVGDDHVVVALR